MVKTTCRNSQWASEEGRKRTKVTVNVVSMVVGVVELTEDGLKNEKISSDLQLCVAENITHRVAGDHRNATGTQRTTG